MTGMMPDGRERPDQTSSETPEYTADSPWVSLHHHPDGDLNIDGNRSGLERLASILTRCAADSSEAREYRSTGAAVKDLRELLRGGHGDSSIEGINLLERPRPVRGQPAGFGPWLREKLILIGCAATVFVVAMLLLLGAGVVLGRFD